MKYCDHKLIPSKEIIGDKVCTKCKKSFRSLKRNRLSMKLLWKLFTHASAPKNDVASFLEFVEVYMKPLKP